MKLRIIAKTIIYIWVLLYLQIGTTQSFKNYLLKTRENSIIQNNNNNNDIHNLLYICMYGHPDDIINQNLSLIDAEENGNGENIETLEIAVKHYVIGVSVGLADPILASKFLEKSSNYFIKSKDTLGSIHALYHRLRMNYDTRMYQLADIKLTNSFYNQLLSLSRSHSDPISKVLYAVSVLTYHDYHSKFENLDFYLPYIDNGIKSLSKINCHKDYYAYLLYSAIGLIHSKNQCHDISRVYHTKALACIDTFNVIKYRTTLTKIASMNLEYGQAFDAINLLKLSVHLIKNNKFIKIEYYHFDLDYVTYYLLFKSYFHIKDYKHANEALKHMETTSYIIKDANFKSFTSDYNALIQKEQNTEKIAKLQRLSSKRMNGIIFLISSIIILLLTHLFFRMRAFLTNEKLILQDMMFTTIGHDLLSPIGQIDYLIQHQINNEDRINENEIKTMIMTISQKLKVMESVLKNTLSIYTYDSVKVFQSELNYTDFQNIISEQINNVQNLYEGTAQLWEYKKNQDENLKLQLDSANIEILIRNLFSNIKRHSQATIVNISAHKQGYSYYNVIIEDNGVEWPYKYKMVMTEINNTTFTSPKLGIGSILIKYFLLRTKSKLTYKRIDKMNVTTLSIPRYKSHWQNIKDYILNLIKTNGNQHSSTMPMP